MDNTQTTLSNNQNTNQQTQIQPVGTNNDSDQVVADASTDVVSQLKSSTTSDQSSSNKNKDPLAALEELLKKTPRTDERNKKVQEEKARQVEIEKQKIAVKIQEQQQQDNQQLVEKRQLVEQVVKKAQDGGQIYKTEASTQTENQDAGLSIPQIKRVKV